jgi:hypothetical protein
VKNNTYTKAHFERGDTDGNSIDHAKETIKLHWSIDKSP